MGFPYLLLKEGKRLSFVIELINLINSIRLINPIN